LSPFENFIRWMTCILFLINVNCIVLFHHIIILNLLNIIIWWKSTIQFTSIIRRIHVILQIKLLNGDKYYPLPLLNRHHHVISFNLKFRKKKEGQIIIFKFHFLIDLSEVSLSKVNKSKKTKHTLQMKQC
jgi:hypothetical protein